MLRIMLGVAAGAVLGGLFGYFSKCHGGTCPLTCNPIGGVITGALLGGLLVSTLSRPAAPFTPSPHVIELSTSAAFEAVLQSNEVVLADFYADWCGPCRRLKPTIHELADAYQGRVAVVGVNVDRAQELARKHGVSGIPDVRLFRSGRQVEAFVGLRGRETYARALDQQLAPRAAPPPQP